MKVITQKQIEKIQKEFQDGIPAPFEKAQFRNLLVVLSDSSLDRLISLDIPLASLMTKNEK